FAHTALQLKLLPADLQRFEHIGGRQDWTAKNRRQCAHNDKWSEAAVFGVGLMGAALARAFVENGHSVTVWNRSPAAALLVIWLTACGSIPTPTPTLAATRPTVR